MKYELELMSLPTVPLSALSKLLPGREIAERITPFYIEKPSNQTFKAGQCPDVTLLDPSVTAHCGGEDRSAEVKLHLGRLRKGARVYRHPQAGGENGNSGQTSTQRP
jgi:hypothetical protein